MGEALTCRYLVAGTCQLFCIIPVMGLSCTSYLLNSMEDGPSANRLRLMACMQTGEALISGFLEVGTCQLCCVRQVMALVLHISCALPYVERPKRTSAQAHGMHADGGGTHMRLPECWHVHARPHQRLGEIRGALTAYAQSWSAGGHPPTNAFGLQPEVTEDASTKMP